MLLIIIEVKLHGNNLVNLPRNKGIFTFSDLVCIESVGRILKKQ